jgi:hypothetical protein
MPKDPAGEAIMSSSEPWGHNTFGIDTAAAQGPKPLGVEWQSGVSVVFTITVVGFAPEDLRINPYGKS